MASLEVVLGVVAAVVLLGVLAVRASVRLGLPSLLIYLAIGILLEGHQPRRHAHHGDAERQHGDGDRGRHRRHGRQRGRHRRDAARPRSTAATRPWRSRWRSTRSAGSPSNALFNLIDAILGDPLISTAFKGEDPALALATVTGTTLSATGAVTVAATNRAALNATVSNAAASTAGGAVQRQGHGGRRDRGVQQGLQRRPRDARRRRGHAGRRGRGHARATTASIHANIKVVASSITTNNGGTAVLQQEINNFKSRRGLPDHGRPPGHPPRPDRAHAGRQGLRVDGRRRAGRPGGRRLHRPRPVEAGARHPARAAGHQLHAVAVDRDRRRGSAQRRPRRRQRDAEEPRASPPAR